MLITLLIACTLGNILVPLSSPDLKLHDIISSKFKSLSGLKDSKLFNYGEYYYSARIQIGTKGQNFSVIIDTGSSYNWVEQKPCNYCAKLPHQFSPGKSDTYSNLTHPVELNYMDGSYAFGYLSQDVIGIDDNNTISAKAYFVLVTEDSLPKSFKSVDGILGLGFKELSDDYETLIDSLYEEKKINRRIFALYLNHLGDIGQQQGYGNKPSTMQIGAYDIKKYSPNGKTSTIKLFGDTGFWYSDISSFRLGNYEVTNIPVIFDSGTTLMIFDSNTYSNLFYTLSSNHYCIDVGVIACECHSKDDMPRLHFKIGGSEFELSQDISWYYEKDTCVLLVQGSETSTWVLGIAFLQNFYTVFDMDNQQITFASLFEDSSLRGMDLIWLALALSFY